MAEKRDKRGDREMTLDPAELQYNNDCLKRDLAAAKEKAHK